ncbi:MAG: protease modulator HflC [Candidatus Krumholzibacteria bacterium]|jgi:membrane protease subunit HflC|nr:protease modulator HflC [Candidatus Krumholzibacteria bacterium]
MNRTLAIILGILILMAVSGTLYVVPEYEQIIITQFGKPVGNPVATPGLKVKLPFVQKVHRFEKRFLEWDGEPNELPTRDKRFIDVNTYARWRITDPLLFFQRLRDERGAQTRLDDILDGETRNAIAKYDVLEVVRSTNREAERTEIDPDDESRLESIVTGRERIRLEILSNAQQRTTNLGIEVLDVQLKRINYIPQVQRSVFERMIAERKRIADRFRSEGEGEASRINGLKERDLLRVQSEAYRTAEEIRGRADALATNIYAAAFDRSAQSREFYTFLKTMESYEQTFDKDSRLILTTDSDFYRFIKRSR